MRKGRDVRLKGYRLDERWGSPELAVWRGVDLRTELPIRLRCIENKAGSAAVWQRRIREAARLDHPCIASVLEMGIVEEAEALEEAGIAVGDFYVVSLGRDGDCDLRRVWREVRWSRFRQDLVETLEALAHAHARGVVHGGLTPAALALSPESKPGVRIYEFGLNALGMNEAGAGDRQGLLPSDDLFSLGRIAFHWLYGRLPEDGERRAGRGEAHHFVPRGFLDWIARCLHPNREERYEFAADAIWALEGSSEGGDTAFPTRLPAGWRGADKDRSEAKEIPDQGQEWWRCPKLYRERRVKMVAREEERDRLWHLASRVSAQERAQVVFIRGAAGHGKSRLVAWLKEKLHERGLAHSLEIGRNLRIDLGDAVVSEDTPDLWSQGSKRALLAKVSAGRALTVVEISDGQWASESLDWVEEIMKTPQGLPVLFLVTICDEDLAERPVETVQVDQLLEMADAQELRLEPLDASATMELVCRLAPLEERLAFELAQRIAGNPLFAVQLIGSLVSRGALRPSDRKTGRLTLAESEKALLPTGLVEVWDKAIEDFVGQFGAEKVEVARRVLEAAAALGMEVSFEQWVRLCDRLGLEIPEMMIHGLFAHRLAVEVVQGERLRFAHSMLREALQEEARRQKRYTNLHRECAQMLIEIEEESAKDLAEQIGVHLFESGDCEEALEYLLLGSRHLGNSGDQRRAQALLERYQRACDGLGLAAEDPRRIRGWLRQAWSCHALGQIEEAEDYLGRATQNLRKQDQSELLGPMRWIESSLAFSRGNLAEVERILEETLGFLSQLDDKRGVATTELRLGTLFKERGQARRSEKAFLRAQRGMEELGDIMGVIKAVLGVTTALRNQGRFHEAIRALQHMVEPAAKAGSGLHAEILNSLGEVYRAIGDWDRAEYYYRGAMELWGAFHDLGGVMARANLGMTLVQQGRFREAQVELEEAEQVFASKDLVRDQIYVLAALMPCLAAREQWSNFCEYAGIVEAFIKGNRIRSSDFEAMFAISAELADESAPEAVSQWARELWKGQLDSAGASVERGAMPTPA